MVQSTLLQASAITLPGGKGDQKWLLRPNPEIRKSQLPEPCSWKDLYESIKRKKTRTAKFDEESNPGLRFLF